MELIALMGVGAFLYVVVRIASFANNLYVDMRGPVRDDQGVPVPEATDTSGRTRWEHFNHVLAYRRTHNGDNPPDYDDDLFCGRK